MIDVSYSLIHTGGYDFDSIMIEAVCGPTGSFQPPMVNKVGSGDSEPDLDHRTFSGECMENCLDSELRGQLGLNGLLTAGVSYSCVVIAGNEKGEFYFTPLPVAAQTGKISLCVKL